MATNKTVWKLEPHTKGKHSVLRNYLNAWLPILGAWNDRILFIDGFAGPGEYERGAEGSPIIALRAFLEHRFQKKIGSEVVFIFIEKDERRVLHLNSLISKWRSRLPHKCIVNVIHGVFDKHLTEVFDYLDSQKLKLAPSFVMIDPFGVSGTPMTLISRILENQKCEVYISFMYESINRFKCTPEFEASLDELFGCKTWRNGIDIENSNARQHFFYNLYESQLRKAGARYVIHFDLYEGNRLVYAIFFGTQNLMGCDRMKSAIWKVDPTGNFKFRGTRSHQLTIDLFAPNYEPLKEALRIEFGGKGWVRIQDVTDFVKSDRTDYCSNHLKKSVLVPLENSGEIEIDETTRKRKRTFPNKTVLKFVKN